MTRWEYNYATFTDRPDLESLDVHGRDGWEAFAVTSQSYQTRGGGTATELIYHLRRPLKESASDAKA